MLELPEHDLSATDKPMDNRLVDDGPQSGTIVAGQDLLAGEAHLDTALYVVAVQFTRAASERLAGVVLNTFNLRSVGRVRMPARAA